MRRRSRWRGLRRAQAAARLGRRGLRVARRRIRFIQPHAGETNTAVFLVELSVAAIATTTYIGVSLQQGVLQFWRAGPERESLVDLSRGMAPFRIINNYHLFASITRERVEPTVELFDGASWTEFDLRYKPGDPTRAPPFVAPHQPRLDFQLWFYGLRSSGRPPDYVVSLLTGLCREPEHFAALFAEPLPAHPAAARMAFYRYRFSTPEQHATTGAWWSREPTGRPVTLECGSPSAP